MAHSESGTLADLLRIPLMYNGTEQTRGLLVLDAAYSLDTVRRRGVEHSILCRDLDGYFARVWSVSPLVGADPDSTSVAFGSPRVTGLRADHEFIEGFVGLSQRLTWLAPVNFLLAQGLLFGRLLAIVRSGSVSAVRVGDPYYLGVLGLALARLARAPLVIRINGDYDAVYERTRKPAFPRLFRSRKIEKLVERFVLRRADFVTAANRSNLDFAIRNGADPAHLAVFPYGNLVDPVHFVSPGERGSFPDDAPAGLFCAAVTRLDAVKRVDDLVEAFATARRERPELQLLLIGEGDRRRALTERAEELGVRGAVFLPGERDQEWIARVLPAAGVLLAASAGRALVEAALSGRPIVAYDDDWHGELVHDGETGRLVPVGDVAALSAAVLDLLDDPALARTLGANGRAAALRMMDPAKLDARERAVYEQLLQ